MPFPFENYILIAKYDNEDMEILSHWKHLPSHTEMLETWKTRTSKKEPAKMVLAQEILELNNDELRRMVL